MAPASALTIRSAAFDAGAPIPVEHTCDGKDASPPLEWGDPPRGTRGMALIVDDPDAPGGDWVHWVLYAIPPAARSLPRGIPTDGTLREPDGARQGRNDFGGLGWGGPCPPPGKPHRYVFKLHALDAPVDLPPGATKRDLERAMKGHVLARAEMHGTYTRKR